MSLKCRVARPGCPPTHSAHRSRSASSDCSLSAGQGVSSPWRHLSGIPPGSRGSSLCQKAINGGARKEIAGKVRAAPGGRGKQAGYSGNKLKPSSLRKGNRVSAPQTTQSMAHRSHVTENTRTRLMTVLKTDVGFWPSVTFCRAPLKFTLTQAPETLRQPVLPWINSDCSSRTMQYGLFSIRLLSLIIIFVRFVQVVHISNLLDFTVELSSIVWVYQNLFTCSSGDKYFGCL